MSTAHSGIDVSLVSTTRRDELGSIVQARASDGSGLQTWIYVFNDEPTVAFAAGDIVVRDPSATTEGGFGGLVAPSGTAAPLVAVLGVAQHAIPAGSYGYLLTRGKGVVKNGTANITADSPITAGGDRDGAAIDFAAGAEHAIIGMALEAEATDNVTFDAILSIP